MTRCSYLISTTKEASKVLEKECPYCMQKVIKSNSFNLNKLSVLLGHERKNRLLFMFKRVLDG